MKRKLWVDDLVILYKSRAYNVKNCLDTYGAYDKRLTQKIIDYAIEFNEKHPRIINNQAELQTKWESTFPGRWGEQSFLRDLKSNTIEFFLECLHPILSDKKEDEYRETFEKMIYLSRFEIRKDAISWTLGLLAFLKIVGERYPDSLPKKTAIKDQSFVKNVDYLACALSYSAIKGSLGLFVEEMRDADSQLRQSIMSLAKYFQMACQMAREEDPRLFYLFDVKVFGPGGHIFKFTKVELKRTTRIMKANSGQDLYDSLFNSFLEAMRPVELEK